MSDQTSGHARFDELAAGYALDALEPFDEELFLEHARGCPQCGQALAGFRDVAASLADTAPPAEPSAQLGLRILAMARAGAPATPAAPIEPQQGQHGRNGRNGQPGKLPPGVHRLRPRGNRWLRPASIAAAVVLIAAGGVWGGLEATSSSPPRPAAFCAHGCSEIVLTAKGTHQVSAKVFIRSQSVWMEAIDMRPDDTADQIYVLWQITGSKRPLAIGSFDVRAGMVTPVEVGSLPAPYHGTLAFAVSLEHGRSIPASPTGITAIGQVT